MPYYSTTSPEPGRVNTILLVVLIASIGLDWAPLSMSEGLAVKLSHVMCAAAALKVCLSSSRARLDGPFLLILTLYSARLFVQMTSIAWSQQQAYGAQILARDAFYLFCFAASYQYFLLFDRRTLLRATIMGATLSMTAFIAITAAAHLTNGSNPLAVATQTIGQGDLFAFKREYFYRALVYMGNAGEEGLLTGKITHSVGLAHAFFSFVAYCSLRDLRAELSYSKVLWHCALYVLLFGILMIGWSYSSRVQVVAIILLFTTFLALPRTSRIIILVMLGLAVVPLTIGVSLSGFSISQAISSIVNDPRATDFWYILERVEDSFPIGSGIGSPISSPYFLYEFPHNIFLADAYVAGLPGLVAGFAFFSGMCVLAWQYVRFCLKTHAGPLRSCAAISLFPVLMILMLSQVTALGQFDTTAWVLLALGFGMRPSRTASHTLPNRKPPHYAAIPVKLRPS